jgi:type II secretion system protein G
MRNTRDGGAFTLIELLIVVAIIAILAMIAVPNFLEAQTRSKVARVKNDLRMLAVAQEAYYLDWNSYTNLQTGTDTPWTARGLWAGLAQLTTPVAYITSIPRDPFGVSHYTTTPNMQHHAVYEMGTGIVGVGGSMRPWENPTPRGMPSNTYEVESDGPDHFDETIGTLQDGTSSPFSTGDYPWPAVQSNATNIRLMSALCYDPTNGTVSWGDILRPGGMKPPGLIFDIFWQNGTR